jgi:hypothetical protein
MGWNNDKRVFRHGTFRQLPRISGRQTRAESTGVGCAATEVMKAAAFCPGSFAKLLNRGMSSLRPRLALQYGIYRMPK